MKKDRRGGFYWVNDRPYVSVTTVLKVIDKPAILWWFGKSVYEAVIQDPTIDEKTALLAPYAVSKSAQNRGTTVHDLIEAEHQGEVSPLLEGYMKAYRRWKEDYQPTDEVNEQTVVNEHYGYAGTLDRVCTIGGKKTIVDFKTSKTGEIYPEAHMQISAYLPCTDAEAGMVVGLSPDGNYHVQTLRKNFEVFESALKIYAFINEEKLKKFGWNSCILQ